MLSCFKRPQNPTVTKQCAHTYVHALTLGITPLFKNNKLPFRLFNCHVVILVL